MGVSKNPFPRSSTSKNDFFETHLIIDDFPCNLRQFCYTTIPLSELPAVDKDLLPCPCTEAQAYTDRARFIVGAECDDDPTVPCPLSPKAKACYVSLQPT